jgi:hypothetical protein
MASRQMQHRFLSQPEAGVPEDCPRGVASDWFCFYPSRRLGSRRTGASSQRSLLLRFYPSRRLGSRRTPPARSNSPSPCFYPSRRLGSRRTPSTLVSIGGAVSIPAGGWGPGGHRRSIRRRSKDGFYPSRRLGSRRTKIVAAAIMAALVGGFAFLSQPEAGVPEDRRCHPERRLELCFYPSRRLGSRRTFWKGALAAITGFLSQPEAGVPEDCPLRGDRIWRPHGVGFYPSRRLGSRRTR